MLELDESIDNIEKIINDNKDDGILSFFYFTASWCGPCKKIYPYIDKLDIKLNENNKKIRVYKIDIDKNDQFCHKCGVRSVPTFAIMYGLNILSMFTGANFDKLSDMIVNIYNEHLKTIHKDKIN